MRARIRTAGLVALGALACATPAHAMSETTNCVGLQGALNQAVAGDTITLDEMCTKSNSNTSNGAFTLPPNAAFTLTGLAGSGAGFDGTGVTGSVLYGASVGGTTSTSTFTLSSLTVQNNTGTTLGPIKLVTNDLGGITVQSMKFINNSAVQGASAGGLYIYVTYCPLSPATASGQITLTGSTFTGNSVTDPGSYALGGGATIYAGCDASTRPVMVTNNVFSGNHVSSGASTTSYLGVLGGGLAVINEASSTEPLTQSGNTFTGNSATGASGVTTANYGGGGEWIEGMNLTSTNDSFIGNTATGATSTGWTYGAGLGIVNSSCTTASHTVGTATQLISAGNTITGGTPANVNGAGIYTGCGVGTGSDLTLQDSTVSGNSSVAGSVAGIGGESVDHLTLENTIDTGNIGGTDLGGFNGTGGSITATYSDACASGAALPGTANICAPPALVSATDVHETASSPTIDKGSNALIPAGLTMDFFGNTRALAGTAVCAVPFPPAIVDIGAAEYVPANPNCTNPKPNPNPTPAPPSPHVTKAIFDNQRIVLTTPSLSACTANTKRLPVRVASTRIKGSTGAKLKFSSVAFYLDKGIKHTTHRRHKGKTVTVTVYLANATAHHVPVTVHLSLAGLKSGTHKLKVVLSYKKHVKKKTVTVTKTMKARFVVC
jgi:hypothetical protein